MPTPASCSPEPPAIRIAGWGLVTPLGRSSWETFTALLAGGTIADRAAVLDENIDPMAMIRALGCVAHVQHSAADPSVELAETAAREALDMAGVGDGEPIDVVLGVSKGAMVALTQATGDHRTLARTAPVVALGPAGFLASELKRRLPIASITTVVAACASSLTALHMARQRLLTDEFAGQRHRILVLTSEAALLPAFVHSYARLGVLPPLTPSQYRGRPLDRRRAGFMLAEQAAAVVLECGPISRGVTLQAGTELIREAKARISSSSSLTKHDHRMPPRPACHLLATAIATEGHDLIRAAPGMPALAHVARRLIGDRPMAMIHPHATGTPEHDEAELDVYQSVMAQRQSMAALPDLYAVKGAIGHGLGAAGLVSLVIACLCHRTGRRPPMPWLDQPIASELHLSAKPPPAASMSTTGGTPVGTSVGTSGGHAIFAAGFGGHVAGALIGDM